MPPAAAAPCSQSGGWLAAESAQLCGVANLQTAYAPAASDLVVVMVRERGTGARSCWSCSNHAACCVTASYKHLQHAVLDKSCMMWKSIAVGAVASPA